MKGTILLKNTAKFAIMVLFAARLSTALTTPKSSRRNLFQSAGAALILLPSQPCQAGEIGAKITQAVTTSEIGISVRRSVVKGAQVMDRLDQQAERFSDRFSLGSERSQQQGRPKPKVIPPAKPLDGEWAAAVVRLLDRNFCQAANVRPETLDQLVKQTTEKLRPSFERAGLDTTRINDETALDGDLFNFASYIHYKSYLDLLSKSRMDFSLVKNSFEEGAAKDLSALLLPDNQQQPPVPVSPHQRREAFAATVSQVDTILTSLVEKGLVAQVDQSKVDGEDMEDWSRNLAELSLSIALDGDVTLPSQLLFQEQGYRFYPNYAHMLVKYALERGLPGQTITVEDYYLDTDYNSDPDKFEVKEVLLNVNIESS